MHVRSAKMRFIVIDVCFGHNWEPYINEMPSECICARVGARNCVLRGGAPGLPGEVTICGGGAPCDAAFCRNSSIASAAVLCWQ